MRILIMDEPTAALSRRESEELYEIARDLREPGNFHYSVPIGLRICTNWPTA